LSILSSRLDVLLSSAASFASSFSQDSQKGSKKGPEVERERDGTRENQSNFLGDRASCSEEEKSEGRASQREKGGHISCSLQIAFLDVSQTFSGGQKVAQRAREKRSTEEENADDSVYPSLTVQMAFPGTRDAGGRCDSRHVCACRTRS